MNTDGHSSFPKVPGLLGLAVALLGVWFAFQNIPLPAEHHPFPMIRSGGLFLIIVGVGMILGAIVPTYSWHAFGAGVFIASTALTLTARPLTALLGRPTRFQIGALIVAVIVELVLIFLLPRLFPPKNELGFRALLLLIVGIHFLIMIPAFGPLIAILGILVIINAGVGIWKESQIAFHSLWGIDGILKLTIGALMFCFPFVGV